MATNLPIENYIPAIKEGRQTLTKLPVVLSGTAATLTVGGSVFGGSGTSTLANATTQNHAATAAVPITATATAAQVATGYLTSTSAAAVTITLPTGTLLGAALGATAGTVFELYVDNTAGANTVTMAVATNGVKSDAANTTAASFGQLTVASGVTGLARFTLMFSSATAYAFTRTA